MRRLSVLNEVVIFWICLPLWTPTCISGACPQAPPPMIISTPPAPRYSPNYPVSVCQHPDHFNNGANIPNSPPPEYSQSALPPPADDVTGNEQNNAVRETGEENSKTPTPPTSASEGAVNSERRRHDRSSPRTEWRCIPLLKLLELFACISMLSATFIMIF